MGGGIYALRRPLNDGGMGGGIFAKTAKMDCAPTVGVGDEDIKTSAPNKRRGIG